MKTAALLEKARQAKAVVSNAWGELMRPPPSARTALLYEELVRAIVHFLILDVSPSMLETDYPPSRLQGAIKAALGFLQELKTHAPQDVVGIVSFSQSARIVSPLGRIGAEYERHKAALQSMQVDPYTNPAAGLKLAAQEIAKVPEVRNARAILLTDGQANTGGCPVKAAKRFKEQGIQLDVIGIGGSPSDVNEAGLKEMASVVGGERRYWFIRSVGELVSKFESLAFRKRR